MCSKWSSSTLALFIYIVVLHNPARPALWPARTCSRSCCVVLFIRNYHCKARLIHSSRPTDGFPFMLGGVTIKIALHAAVGLTREGSPGFGNGLTLYPHYYTRRMRRLAIARDTRNMRTPRILHGQCLKPPPAIKCGSSGLMVFDLWPSIPRRHSWTEIASHDPLFIVHRSI